MKPSDYFRIAKTDKHHYHVFYDMAIPLLTAFNNSIRVLEIGCTAMLNTVGSGSSNAFSKMPFVEKYVGIDRVAPENDFGEKATFLQGDAYTSEMVDKAGLLAEDYHLIIDDGNHDWRSQIKFFQMYERLCAPKSIVACEDVNTLRFHLLFDGVNDERLCAFITTPKNVKVFNSEKNMLAKFNI